jgi:hypothetical protein
MSVKRAQKDTYDQIKKRVTEYNVRYVLAILLSSALAMFFIFSVLPLIPITIILYLRFDLALLWLVWPVCMVTSFLAYSQSSKLIRTLNAKYGITLEEKMFLRAHESLKFLEEYLDPQHPIMGSRMKAARKLDRIYDLLDSTEWSLPNVSIVREQAVQLAALQANLKMRLIPAIENITSNRDKDLATLETSRLALQALVEYLTQPQLDGLTNVNKQMQPLTEITRKSISLQIKHLITKPSILKRILVISSAPAFAAAASYFDVVYLDAKPSDAFVVGIAVVIGILGIYVTYLVGTRTAGSKT